MPELAILELPILELPILCHRLNSICAPGSVRSLFEPNRHPWGLRRIRFTTDDQPCLLGDLSHLIP